MVSNAFTAKSGYDVFLSYNSADHDVVEEIARKLRDKGLEPFLDRWYLAPGARWRSKLEDTLSSCKAIAIFIGQSEMGSWQQREVDVALDLQSRSPNFPVIPVLLPGCEPPLGFLRQLTWVDLRTQTHDLGIVILAKAACGEAPGADLQKHLDAVRASICPYRGLLHFREEDAPFFFGREAAIDKLMDAVQRQPFVAVVGASGSGKSSVVRAGLVPRLRSDRRTAWETVILVPTDQPFKALARALVRLLEPTMGEVDRLVEATKLAEHFRSGTISLYDVVERILEKQSGTNRVLIVVDQFEELYTLTSNEEARRRFLDELLAASSRTGSKANIALTLRGDFVGKAFAHRPLSDRLQGAQQNLGPMTREELREAVAGPAAKVGLSFEPGLIDRMLEEAGEEPGNLPLLEFILRRLWEDRQSATITHAAYEALGGLHGALAKRADEVFNRLTPVEQDAVKRVFLQLVRPGDGGEDTGRRTTFEEIGETAWGVVRKMADERLLVTTRWAGESDSVEVSHETLIRHWGQLRTWLNQDRELLLWRERFRALFNEWRRNPKDHTTLLRGGLLVEAQRWLSQRGEVLPLQERHFIAESARIQQESTQREQKRVERELQQRRRATRRLWFALVSVAIAFAAVCALYYIRQWLASVRNQAVLASDADFAIAERLAQQNPSNTQWQRDLSASHELRGNLLFQQGKASEALEHYQASRAILERLVQKDSSNAEWQQYLAETDDKVAFTLYVLRNVDDALQTYEAGRAIAARLVQQDPNNARWQRILSSFHASIGRVLELQDKLPEALQAYEASRGIAERLAQQDPTNAQWKNELSFVRERVAEVRRRQQEPAGGSGQRK